MGDYFPPMTAHPRKFNDPGNLIFSSDGTVWANYLLRGINTDPYDTSRIAAAQTANERLFSALSRLPFTEGLLLGAKAKTPAEVILGSLLGTAKQNGLPVTETTDESTAKL